MAPFVTTGVLTLENKPFSRVILVLGATLIFLYCSTEDPRIVHPKTIRQRTRYHGGDFAPNPGPSEAWRAWKKGCMAPSSCLRETACMRCCAWNVAHSANTVHRKRKVRFLGRGPGFQAVDPKPQPGNTQDQTGLRLALKSRAAFEEPGINPRSTRDRLSLPAWFAAPIHRWASCLKTSLP